MNSLCKKLPDSKLDSSNSLSQRVYTVLISNCHKAARYTSITRQGVQDYITISVHFLGTYGSTAQQPVTAIYDVAYCSVV